VYYRISDDSLAMSGLPEGNFTKKFHRSQNLGTSEDECPVYLDANDDLPEELETEWSRERVKTDLKHVCELFSKQPASLVLSILFAIAVACVAIAAGAINGQLEVFAECE
jgi:hypothetical protein